MSRQESHVKFPISSTMACSSAKILRKIAILFQKCSEKKSNVSLRLLEESSVVATFMEQKKISALMNGRITDCSFLVGPHELTSRLLHAFQCDLILASEKFEAMLNTSHKNPIRIKNHDGRIFAMLLQFIHIHVLKEDIETLEDAIALSLAADEYLVEPLLKLCASIVKKMINSSNVWLVLDALSHRFEFRSVCIEILSRETTSCIGHPDFLKVSQQSIAILLQLDSLNVNSENDLVNACIKWSSSSPQNHIRYLLPYLRLLTLDVGQVSSISKLLNTRERAGLAHAIVFDDKSFMPASLCPNPKPRKPYRQPPKEVKNCPFKYGLNQMVDFRQRNVIKFTAGQNMQLASLEILSHVNQEKGSKGDLLENNVHMFLSIEITPPHGKPNIKFAEKITEPKFVFSPFIFSFKNPLYLTTGSRVLMCLLYGPGVAHKNFFADGALSANMPKKRNMKCKGSSDVAVKNFRVDHDIFIHEPKYKVGKWKQVPETHQICVVQNIVCKFF
ncbi:uncharacterized protein LOC132203438 isoform X2 [Neocloeon triangulifer]|uniref:uncharacterized protein LOC132203438 isoform X2 n=1 Tax=Neocloeon triangulifer TaxID=2078957 RepID=UPI00286ED418|nr:uncharacterized protein LOC132203438 isoform X2 [Neocloeon triangulifer]